MNQDRLKRERQEKTRVQKQKRMMTAVILILIVALAAALAVISLGGKKDSKEQTANVQNTKEQTEKQKETQENEAAITLTEEQKYTGDLILVNSEYAYHFEENQDLIGLVDVGTYENGVIPVAKEGLQLAGRVMDPLFAMIGACNQALGVKDTGVTSAYRSLEYQQETFKEYVRDYGQEYAEAYVADPGYSEHHTGLSLDMGIYYEDGSADSFSESNNAVWIDEHCGDYGFIRRYQDDKVDITGISNESWHFRYVGIPHAVYMNEKNLCLEEYIEYLRNQTSKDQPLAVACAEGTYMIYAARDSSIPEPQGTYTVSGDNMGGYIITELTNNQ